MSKFWCSQCSDYGFGCEVTEELRFEKTEPKPDCFVRDRDPWESCQYEWEIKQEPEPQTQEPGGQTGIAFEGDQLALGI